MHFLTLLVAAMAPAAVLAAPQPQAPYDAQIPTSVISEHQNHRPTGFSSGENYKPTGTGEPYKSIGTGSHHWPRHSGMSGHESDHPHPTGSGVSGMSGHESDHPHPTHSGASEHPKPTGTGSPPFATSLDAPVPNASMYA